MKTRSKNLSKAILLALLVILTLVFCIPVAAATNSTTLTTTVPSSYFLEVNIEGKGTVTVNSANYTESCAIEIARNSAISVHILPDNDYEIESVSYDGEDITDKAKTGAFFLPVMEKDSQLSIVFVEKAAMPETGDTNYQGVIIAGIVMALSLVCVITILVFQKRQLNH